MNPTTPAAPDWAARAAALRIDGRMLVDGQRQPSCDGGTFDCRSPLHGRSLGPVARGRQADVDLAVAAARRAFERGAWARKTQIGRAHV